MIRDCPQRALARYRADWIEECRQLQVPFLVERLEVGGRGARVALSCVAVLLLLLYSARSLPKARQEAVLALVKGLREALPGSDIEVDFGPVRTRGRNGRVDFQRIVASPGFESVAHAAVALATRGGHSAQNCCLLVATLALFRATSLATSSAWISCSSAWRDVGVEWGQSRRHVIKGLPLLIKPEDLLDVPLGFPHRRGWA